MNMDVGNLEPPVFRPPSEWDSLLIKVTNGCTHRCTFCSMYLTKKFSMRKDIEDIKNDIRKARKMFGHRVENFFFEDGNAFVVKSDVLIELTKFCYQQHPNLRKVSAYAHVQDVLKKSDDDLKRLSDAGFIMVYVGIESGDDQVLRECNCYHRSIPDPPRGFIVIHPKNICHDLRLLQTSTSSHFLIILAVACGNRAQL